MVKSIFNVLKSSKSTKTNKRILKSKHSLKEDKGINSEESIISQLEEEFIVGPVKLRQIVQHFLIEYKKGLENEDSTLAMIPSFVTKLPSGKELGNYISNFKVSEIFLERQCQVRIRQKKFSIPETAKSADGERLFDFMADSVESFLKESGALLEREYELGFTFSFPVRQTGINSGELYLWSKEFNCANTQGRDVVKMLNE